MSSTPVVVAPGPIVYHVESLLFAGIGVSWITVRQTMSPKWPLLDTWAVGVMCVTALAGLCWRTLRVNSVGQTPACYMNVGVFIAYVFGFVLSQLEPDYAAGVTRTTCKCTMAGVYHTTLFFGDSPWNSVLSAVTLAILLAQTILSASCTVFTGRSLESVVWVDMWNLSVLAVVAVSGIHANCDALVSVMPIALGIIGLLHCGLWVGCSLPQANPWMFAMLSLALAVVLDGVALVLAYSYRVVDFRVLAGFLGVPMLFYLRNAMRVEIGQATEEGQPAAVPAPAVPAPSAPPAEEHKNEAAPSAPPPAAMEPTPPTVAPTMGTRLPGYAVPQARGVLHRIDPFVHAQSGYHAPPPEREASVRALFGGVQVGKKAV